MSQIYLKPYGSTLPPTDTPRPTTGEGRATGRASVGVRAAKPRGRPKDEGKRRAVLDAAKTLFSRDGFDRISMEAIAREAGVSKLTLYSHFSNKEELFQQAVAEKCQEYTPPAFFDPAANLPLSQRLLDIGNGFLQLVMSDEGMDLYRMLAAQARGGDERLGRLFFAAGPQRTLERFTVLLQSPQAQRELSLDDPQKAAQHFFCLLKGVHHLRVMVGMSARPPARVLKEHVEDVVDLFLRAYSRKA